MVAVFVEVVLLLPPGTELWLHMIGPDVPEELHGTRWTSSELPGGGSLTVTAWHGCYHQVVQSAVLEGGGGGCCGASDVSGVADLQRAIAGAPHLVFAPNAGIPAFASWEPSLRMMLDTAGGGGGGVARAPFLATDYCEEAVHQSLRLLSDMSPGCCEIQGRLNPFRRPYPTTCHGTALPACSDALIFGWV